MQRERKRSIIASNSTMGNAPPLCPPICNLAAEDSESDKCSNKDGVQQKLAVYGEHDHVNYRCNTSFKMIVPTTMLHGRQGLRVLGFEYRTVRAGYKNGRKDTCYCYNGICRQLYHNATNTPVSSRNFRIHIPECLVNEVSRCCQDIAQDILINEGGLQKLFVRNGETKCTRVAALVDENFCHDTPNYEENKSSLDSFLEDRNAQPILLVINGRGHSRAGIFSRKQLLLSGIESATALSTVKECRKRGMKTILLDHYSQTSQDEMAVFESSLEAIFGNNDEESWHSSSSIHDRHGPVYILAHSASGGKLVRSLLDGNARRYLLPRLLRGGIVFTDSTHNIQWARGVKKVWDLLESSRCIYVRSNMVRSDASWEEGDESRRAGDTVQTDEYWQHRFGDIKTVWAGTAEHSLMNWVARDVVWDHFDNLLEDTSNANDK